MPIIIDKEERRSFVLTVAFDLVADRGIDALTFREIAAATTCSTSIVSHYFRNKNELLFGIYQLANARAKERVEAAFTAGLPLIQCFGEVLPISDASKANWRVWIAFWARAHLEPEYLEERRSAAEQSLELYRRMLLGRSKALPIGEDLTFAARRLIASVAGIALEACFAPDDWTQARMREVLLSELADLGFDAAA